MANTTNPNPDDDQNLNSPVDDTNNPPAPLDGEVEFANMTPREQALVTKARAQEKKKLYSRLQEQEAQAAELRTQLARLQSQPPAPTPTPVAGNGDGTNTAQQEAILSAIRQLQSSIQETQADLRNIREDESRRRRDAELKQYISQRIQEYANEGKDVIAALVGGNSEEEVEESLAIARAEFILAEDRITSRSGGRRTPTQVNVHQSNGRPAGTPPVVTPNTVEADAQDEFMTALRADPDAAVRSGDYQKNRNQILGKFKRGYKYGGAQPTQ